jgi:hypothetical protein
MSNYDPNAAAPSTLANGAIAVDAGLCAQVTGARQSYRPGLALTADVKVS